MLFVTEAVFRLRIRKRRPSPLRLEPLVLLMAFTSRAAFFLPINLSVFPPKGGKYLLFKPPPTLIAPDV